MTTTLRGVSSKPRAHRLWALTLTAGLAALTVAGTAQAQRGRHRDDVIEFSPGERGQEQTVNGRTEGALDASRETAPTAGPCVGWIPLRPNHQIVLTEDFRRLEISVTSSSDTTLVVHGPGGTRCNDDTNGLDPALSGEWMAGTYNVYVGTFTTGVPIDYQLTLRQGRRGRGGHGHWEDDDEEPGATVLDPTSASAVFASMTVPGGLGTDPVWLDGQAGGPVDVRYLGNSPAGPCVGHATGAPSHMLTLNDDVSGLVAAVESAGDTTMVINGPNGWWCNDDAIGVNPAVSGYWPAGVYRVWVGTYAADTAAPYRLSLYRDPSQVPTPAPLPPSSWSFRGAFEGTDVFFQGATVDQVNASCLSYVASSGGARMVDDVTVWSARAHNASSYWDDQELCALVALNTRPDDGSVETTLSGDVEGWSFQVQGSRDEVRRLLRTYVPRLADSGWVDDITINGAHYHNGSSYWDPSMLATIFAYNVEPVGSGYVARGTIESTPFVFSGATANDVQSECNAFFASGVSDSMIDDITVNGQPRHNGPSYWDAGQTCMLVTSLATPQ